MRTTSPQPMLGPFLDYLRHMTPQQLVAMARHLEQARATPVNDLDWWRATAAVATHLRRLRRTRAAAIASMRASDAVLAAPGAADVPHDQVVRVARAAGDVGRALVADAPPFALTVLAHGWTEVFGAASGSTPPAAA